jgi:hypothetical protein
MAIAAYAADATRYLGIVIIFICSTTTILFLSILKGIPNHGNNSTSIEPLQRERIAALDVYIPKDRKDDTFVNVSTVLRSDISPDNKRQVNISIDSQLLPLSLDTSWADLMVAADGCDKVSPDSGCYGLQTPFKTSVRTLSITRSSDIDQFLGND